MPYYDGNNSESPLHLPEPSSPQTANHSLTTGSSPYGAAVPVNPLPPALAASPDVTSLLKALKRHWLSASALGLLAAVAASAAVWYLMPTKYTAEVMLTVSNSTLVKTNTEEKESPSPFTKETLLALPRTAFVIQAAVTRSDIAKPASIREQLDPVGWLRSRIDVSAISPELMTISMTGTDPQEMEALVDGVAHVYADKLAEAERAIRMSQVEKLDKMIEKLQGFVNLRKQSYRQLVNEIGAASSGQRIVKSQFDNMMLEYLLKEQVVERQKLARLQLGLQQMGDHKNPHVPRQEIEKRLNEHKGYQSVTADIETLQTLLAQAEQVYVNKKHPRLEETRDRIKKLEQQRLELRKKLIPEIKNKLAEFYEIVGDDTEEDTKAEISTTQMLINLMQSEIDRLSESRKRQGSDSLDLDEKLAEFQTEQGVVNSLRDTRARVNALLQESVSTVQVKDKVRSYPNVNVKKQIMMAGGAGGAALGLVLLAFAYLEFRLRRINTVEDVVYGLGWRLVGQLPALPESTRGLLRKRADPRYWQSLMTESVDATRTMILHAARVDGIRTVMVTSAVAGEGKTSLSCHLACSLARAGRKTLLLDCDLRNPAAHRLFDLEGEPGLCEVLRGEAQLGDVIRATPANNLWLIPAGQFDEQALQMLTLSQEGFAALLERLKTQFDFIVVDSSPVLPVVDSMVIGQNVDVVVFSLLRDVSRIPSVYAAYQRLATLDIRILGAVVNGVDAGSYGYAHRYYAKQEA